MNNERKMDQIEILIAAIAVENDNCSFPRPNSLPSAPPRVSLIPY